MKALVFVLTLGRGSGVGSGGQNDVEAKCSETARQVIDGPLLIAFIVEVGSQICVGSSSGENVVNENEDLAGNRDDGLVLTNPALESEEAHAQEAVFLA